MIFHKHALIEAAAVKARDKNRTNDGQADLAAVGVAAEEQGDAVVRSPDEVVRRVAEAESETVARGIVEIGTGAIPRPFVADDDASFNRVVRLPQVAAVLGFAGLPLQPEGARCNNAPENYYPIMVASMTFIVGSVLLKETYGVKIWDEVGGREEPKASPAD